MSRSVPWKRTVSDAISWFQDQALSSTIYILRESGPTAFLLKDEGEGRKFKVYLGDPHTCTCPVFQKERELCKHICWLLLKRFRVPRHNPVTWQLGLVEREINEILRGIAANQKPKASRNAQSTVAASKAGEEDDVQEQSAGTVGQRPIAAEDVCPICQEELLAKHLPVTYCKFGCGNSVHIKCMKVWADHQKSTGDTSIKCPFCREDFGPLYLLQQEHRNTSVRETRAERLNQHLGCVCKRCHTSPITGKCYKCSVCVDYNLCQTCFNAPVHMDHAFQFREKSNQRWRSAQRGSGTALPQAVIQSLMNRDISERDYDLLLQLEGQSAPAGSDITEASIQSLPMEKVRSNGPLLAPGQQCRICLQRYLVGQHVHRLPCTHKFHRECIETWLLHQHPTCPIDGTIYTNQGLYEARQARQRRTSDQSLSQPTSADNTRRHPRQQPSIQRHNSLPSMEDLIVPGLAITRAQTTTTITSRSDVDDDIIALIHRGQRLLETSRPAAGAEQSLATAARSVSHHSDSNLTNQSSSNNLMSVNGNQSAPPIHIPIGAEGSRPSPIQREGRRPSLEEGPGPRDKRAGQPKKKPNSLSGSRYTSIIESSMMSVKPFLFNKEERKNVSIVTLEEHQDASAGKMDSSSQVLPLQVDVTRRIQIKIPSIERSQPSIPQLREDSLGAHSVTVQSKPPSGTKTKGRLRKNRSLDSRLLSSNHAARDETSQQNNNHVSDNLYIGMEPSTSEGFSSNFLLSAKTEQTTRQKVHHKRDKVATEPEDMRWGAVRELRGEGNDIVLSGNSYH